VEDSSVCFFYWTSDSVQSSFVGRPPKAIRRDLQGSKFLDEKLHGESHLIFRVAYFLISNLANSHRGIGTSCEHRYKWSEIGIDVCALDYHAGCLGNTDNKLFNSYETRADPPGVAFDL
jgi:hypothetical protein